MKTGIAVGEFACSFFFTQIKRRKYCVCEITRFYIITLCHILSICYNKLVSRPKPKPDRSHRTDLCNREKENIGTLRRCAVDVDY